MIKKFSFAAAALALLALVLQPALAQNAAFQNPTYLPPVVGDLQTTTTTGDAVTFTPYGISGAAVRVTYSGSSFAANVQGTNDGSNWTNLQLTPVAGGATVTSITGAGFWRFNAAGITGVRLHVTTNSGGAHTATARFSGSFSPDSLTLMNPQALTGPIALIDGVSGVNQAEVNATNDLEVQDDSAVTAITATNTALAAVTGTKAAGTAAASAALTGCVYNTSLPSPTNGQQVARQCDASGRAITAPFNQAQTTGGATPTHILTAASTNSTSVKASAGTLYVLTALNTNAATQFIKFYNTAAGPTCNSDTVLLTFAAVQNVPLYINFGPAGTAFGTGIGMCVTGAAADNDNTNATTGGTISIVYK